MQTATSIEPEQITRYTARVVIAVNRTGRKNNVCHDKLYESAVDVAQELRKFFESLNMLVHYKENVDQTAINKLVSTVIDQSSSYGDHEIILFYYIGHGMKGELLPHCTCRECRLPGIVYDRESDGQTQKIDDLIRMFHNGTTKHLRKIPMLFFFDCCQGNLRNDGMKSMGLKAEVQAEEIREYVDRIPDAGNILVALSALPMLKANCHEVHGPIWTRVLLKNLKIDQSIIDALHATQREFSKIVCDTNGTLLPSMFYSTLYCEPINFYAMMSRDSLKTDSETAISSTKDSDSALTDDFYSETIEGDDINGGSKPPQASISAASQPESSSVQESDSDPSKSKMILGSINHVQELNDLKKDIEEKTKKIAQLEEEIARLTQESYNKDAKYQTELAEKERKMNAAKEEYESKLSRKEDELEKMKRDAQASQHRDLEREKELKEVQEELVRVKKEHEEEMKKIESGNTIASLELELKHQCDKQKLNVQISSLQLELQTKKTEVAEERERVAKLEAIISDMKANEANNEINELKASLSSLTLADAAGTASGKSLSVSDDLTGLTLNIDREINSEPGVSSTNLDSPKLYI